MTQDTSSDTHPFDWWRFCWRALMAISAAAAIVASLTYLRDLAIACGWTDWRAYLLPVSLDVLGVAAFALYIRNRDPYAQAVSVLVVAASAAGNALSHLYAVTGNAPSSEVVLIVGSAPVVAAIILAHLWAHERKEANAPVESGDSDTGDSADVHGDGSSDVLDRPERPSARPRPAARRSDGTRRGSPNGLTVPELAALAEREGITSKRRLKAVAHVGDPKVNAAFDLITANRNGH